MEYKKSEENYIDQEIKKLSKEAEILFPNWEFFGFLAGSGCNSDIGYVGRNFTSERLLYEGQIFDIVCHISNNSGACYNYIRFIKRNKTVRFNETSDKKERDTIYESFLKEKAKNTDPLNEDGDNTKDVKQIVSKLNDNLLLRKSIVGYVYDCNDGDDKWSIVPILSEEGEKDITASRFLTTNDNRSIGIYYINRNKEKYAVMCNYTNNSDIMNIKNTIKKNGYKIINLPRVQSDSHSCSVLNKIFLKEINEFFSNRNGSLEKLLEYKKCGEIKKGNENGIIFLKDDAKKLFPNLYKYQQYNVENNNDIPENFKSYLIGTDKYNILTNGDWEKDKQMSLGNKNDKQKVFNVALLREGWGMTIDFMCNNLNDIPLFELEIIIEIFEKQCDFFDRVISLQGSNQFGTNREYFKNREESINKIKKEITQRQKNRKNNKNIKICDLAFDAILVFQILDSNTKTISPKLCEYVKRYKDYFGDKVFNKSKTLSAKNKTIQSVINEQKNKEILAECFRIEYGDGYQWNGASNDKKNNIESIFNKVERKTAFEGNDVIRKGLQAEYQRKYKKDFDKKDNSNSDGHGTNILSGTTRKQDNVNATYADNQEKQGTFCECECNNLCSLCCDWKGNKETFYNKK